MNIQKILLTIALLLIPVIHPMTASAIGSVGVIEPPPGVQQFIEKDNATVNDISILFFISRVIRLIMFIAGGWATIMILLTGYTFITANGDSGSYQKVRNQLTNAVIGLMLIMVTFTITGLISLILFGDPGFLLNPTIERL